MTTIGRSVLELTVNNHPGVMSHVCGLFARRGYNLEGIIVLPIPTALNDQSRMWLLVNEENKLDQVIRQTEKLIDVVTIHRHEVSDSIFEKIESIGP